MHVTAMHCGSQLAAVAHRIHSNCNKNFAGPRSLEKLYMAGTIDSLGKRTMSFHQCITTKMVLLGMDEWIWQYQELYPDQLRVVKRLRQTEENFSTSSSSKRLRVNCL